MVENREISLESLEKGTIPFLRPLPSHLLMAPSPNTITLGATTLTYAFWRDTDIQSLMRGEYLYILLILFPYKRFASSTYLINHLFISIWTHMFILYLHYNPILYYLFCCSNFTAWAIGALLSLVYFSSLDMLHPF